MYYEYKTVVNKVLLSVQDFAYGTSVISTEELKYTFVSIGREEASYLSTNYKAEVDEARQAEEDPHEAIAAITERYKQGLLDKGYVLGKDIEVIIHE